MSTEITAGENTVRVGGETGASFTAVPGHIVLDILPSELAKLPEERRAIVNLISATVREKLIKWDQFTFELPQTEFVANDSSGQSLAPLVAVADLCIQPDATTELAEITRDPETGERRRFTAEQCREVAESGRFSFPSRLFPHVDHVWQLPAWIVRGRKNAKQDFQRRVGNALDHLLMKARNRIYQKRDVWDDDFFSISIVNGMIRVGVNMKRIVGAIIGLPETVPRRREYKDRLEAEKEYVRQKCDSSELLDFAYYYDPSPSVARHSIRFEEEQASAYDETYRIAALETFRDISPDDLTTSERISRIDEKWKEEMREDEVQGILREERLGEQKRLFLVEQARAQHIIQDGQDKLHDRTEREKLRFVDEAKRAHPILSLSHEWLQQRVLQRGVQHHTEWQCEQEDENIEVMRSKGLHRAAKFEEWRLQFEREAWPEIRKSWLKDRVAARVYKHTYVIFDPRRWREGGDSDIRRVRTSTAFVGWRFVLLWRDTVSFLRAGVYFTVITNLWRGPLGIQALFSLGDVPYSWNVRWDGVLHARRFHKSMYTRIRAIWRRVHQLRATFEEDNSLLGKDAVRWLHFITNYGFRGGVSTVLVIVGQPVLTVLNVAVTTVIAATAVLWAPLSALATYCVSWLVYDWRSFERHNTFYLQFGDASFEYIRTSTEHSPRLFPVLSHLFRAVLGTLEAPLSAVGVVLHPTYSIIRSAFAYVQRGVRALWDGMWRGVLRRFGRWPARDSFLAQRVKGVGISDSYYFRLSTELVMRCVRARLETIELKTGREVIEKATRRPVRDLEQFAEDVLIGLFVGPGRWAGVMDSLKKEEKRRMKRIDDAFRERNWMLSHLTDMPHDRERIRPEKGVPPERVLQQCVEIVEKFYEERIATLEKMSTSLWRQAGAAPGDVKTLTRYLLADMYSEQFLTPVEISEQTLEIPVTFDDVINVHAGEKPLDREALARVFLNIPDSDSDSD